MSLRSRFQADSNENLFTRHGSDQEADRVPMDGLALYVEKSWEKIKQQKELNLPDQRIMVASLRCNELKEEALQIV
jgi:hypothetical protein